MLRDFSDEAKQELIQYVDGTTSDKIWGEIRSIIECNSIMAPAWLFNLGIEGCINNVGDYYRNLIDKNNATKQQIEDIFANVQRVDTNYMGKISQYINTGNLWVKYIDDLAGSIDPNGGNLDMNRYRSILDADKEDLDAANMSVVKTLVSDGKIDEAADYVNAVDHLDLTYEEFMALSDEDRMAYLSEASNWLTTLYPNVEMEEGIYEITVPLGVDMSVTYNVTVSGSAETDSSETINVTIDQQQIVLANAQKFECENLSAEMNSDGVSFSNEVGNIKHTFRSKVNGRISTDTVIKNGDSQLKLISAIDLESVKIGYEVSTQLNDNLTISSSVTLEKANNMDMKNWSIVKVEDEKEILNQVYLEMDPLYRESSMKKAEIFIADGISLTQILETLMQLAQYI